MTRLLLLLAFLAACGAPVDAEPEALEADVPVVEAEPEPCGMVFSPVPDLLDATAVAAARWSATTGCDVRVGEGGLPMVVLDQVISRDGRSHNARVDFAGEPGNALPLVLEVRRDRLWEADRLVVHEMGHAIGGHAHTGTGVMRLGSDPGALIDQPSLDLVCPELGCVNPAPEG